MAEDRAGWGQVMLDKVDFYTVKETAQHLRLCEKQIRRLVERGELPAYRFGAAVRIKKQDVDAYVQRSSMSK